MPLNKLFIDLTKYPNTMTMHCRCYPIILIFILLLNVTTSAQVDLPTGKATFTLPIFSYSDGNRLSLDIALNYTGGGGITVNQIPTSVGLGWDLTAGGMIVRRTIGEPDDQIAGTYDGIKFGDGYLVPAINRLNPISPRAGFMPLVSNAGGNVDYQPDFDVLRDLQQDIFEFQFGGRTGRFIVSDDGRVLPLDNSKLKIQKLELRSIEENYCITTIGGFIITDESGIRYTFLAAERSNLIINRNGTYKASGGVKITMPDNQVSQYSTRNTWYLTEIKDPFSGKRIGLTYTDYNLDYLVGYEATFTNSVINGVGKQGGQSIQPRFSGVRKRLSEISFPDNQTKVSFVYNDVDMADLPGEKAMKQILVKRDTEVISGYQFGYEYFFKDSTKPWGYTFTAAEQKYARLSLKTVQKVGKFNIADPPYVFTYNNKLGAKGIPGRTLGSRDHWGYCNEFPLEQDYSTGDNAFGSVKMLTNYQIPYRRVDAAGSAVLGTLKSVQYPTGGKLQYEYENNTAWYSGAAALSGGVRVSRTTMLDMVDTTKKIVKEYKYVNADGTSSGWGYEPPVYSEVSYTNIVVPPSQYGFKSTNFLFGAGMSSIIPNLYIGWSQNNSLGMGAMVIQQLAFQMIIAIVIDILTPPPTTQVMLSTNNQEFSTHVSKNNELPHLYKRVEVLEGSAANNIGKMVYEFTSPDDFPLIIPTQSQPYAPKSRCLPWVYGLPKKVQEISKANKVVSEAIYTYAPQTTVAGNGNIAWRSKKLLMCPESLYAGYSAGIEFYSETYQPLYGRTDLLSVSNKSYDSLGNFSQVLTTYINNPTNLLPAKVNVVSSIGDTIQTRTYYPQDYNGEYMPALKALKDGNAIATPVATETWQLNASGSKLLSASLSDYKFHNAPDIKMEQIQSLEYDTPLSLATAGTFNANTLNRIPAFIKKQQSINYDSKGDAIHISSPNSVEKGYQWGYGSEYGMGRQKITAEVLNAHALHTEKSGAMGAVTNTKVTIQDAALKTYTFTLPQAGTVFLQLEASPLGSNSLLDYTLSGGSPAVSYNGSLCYVIKTGRLGDMFNSYLGYIPQNAFFTGLPAGTYTLTAKKSDYAPSCDLVYTYFTDPEVTVASEFFYEGFESLSYSGATAPYAGKGCKEGDYTVLFTMPNARSYRVDYRYYTAGKWVYNAKPFTNGMILTDGDAIDEVRVYPIDAAISTYTYDYLVGLTSSTDVNGNTVFNEYDYMGRLSIVRDQNRNIIRRICYNYAGQPETCGGQAYSNDALTQTFTKQGCGSSFTPGTGTYTVPAGKYTADDKIAVNAMAQEDMRINGQAYVNQTAQCQCTGVDRKVINGVCEKGTLTYFRDTRPGPNGLCKIGYWYKFSNGSFGPKTYTDEEPCL